MAITLHTQYAIASGVTATNGGIQTVSWTAFNDAAPLAQIYKYFEIVGCRVRVSMASTAAAVDSFQDAVVAWYPLNYTKDPTPSSVPTVESCVTELPGSVYVQYGAKNYGKWFYPYIKEQFSVIDSFSTANNRVCGVLIWYVNDAGISETFGIADIEMNVRFHERLYTASVPTFMRFENPREEFKEDDVDSVVISAGTERRVNKPCYRKLTK